MAPTFATGHTHPVPADGRYRGSPAIRWVVQIRPGGAWTPWQWADRLHNWRLPPKTEDGVRPLWYGFLGVLFARVLATPSVVTYRLRARKRADWEVIVYRGENEKHNRALVENCASRELAAARAEQLWQHLEQHDELPDQQDSP